jgi:hypothetical protein
MPLEEEEVPLDEVMLLGEVLSPEEVLLLVGEVLSPEEVLLLVGEVLLHPASGNSFCCIEESQSYLKHLLNWNNMRYQSISFTTFFST